MLCRVSTATDSHGRPRSPRIPPIIARSAEALSGVKSHSIWGADERVLPRDGSQPSWRSHFPPENGWGFVLLTVQPGQAAAPLDSPNECQLKELAETFPELLAAIEPGITGMHASETFDLAVVLAGPITLELSDSLAKELNTGDAIVQVGNVHRWVNRGAEPAVVAGTTYVGDCATGRHVTRRTELSSQGGSNRERCRQSFSVGTGLPTRWERSSRGIARTSSRSNIRCRAPFSEVR